MSALLHLFFLYLFEWCPAHALNYIWPVFVLLSVLKSTFFTDTDFGVLLPCSCQLHKCVCGGLTILNSGAHGEISGPKNRLVYNQSVRLRNCVGTHVLFFYVVVVHVPPK